MEYVEHILIKDNRLELRKYQEDIVDKAEKNNILCVLPTGLGKTPIAVMLAAKRLEEFPDSKILVLAPTKPLASQNCNSFKYFIDINEKNFQVVTGNIRPENRAHLYRMKKFIFATPQTIQNDIKSGLIRFENFSLLVIDEAHHSIGKYSYPYIAKKYLEESENPRILALTASPGATREKINEICNTLGIELVEIRTERDSDVAPYVKEKEIEWTEVELPQRFLQLKRLIEEAYRQRLEKLKKMGFRKPVGLITKKDLLSLQQALMKLSKQGNKNSYWASSIVAQAIKIDHALELLETQGISTLESYWKRIVHDKSKAGKSVISDENIARAIHLTHKMFEEGCKHPKISRLCTIVSRELQENPNAKIIIFANYRETVKEIVKVLDGMENAKPVMLVGQRSGLTQKAQIESIRKFEEGEYNILVGTSISEEGLHLGSADTAIFYEPVPSEIRAIQRRGRVGRTKVGRIIILYTKKTRDEAYMWAAYHKEKKMRSIIRHMKTWGNVKKGL